MKRYPVAGEIRVPTVIVAVNFARVPKKRPKLYARTIREGDGNRCQYTGAFPVVADTETSRAGWRPNSGN